MKNNLVLNIAALLLTVFGLLTLFLSGSVIFDFFGIRAKEGNYILFIVWANFISSLMYLLTSYGLITNKRWTNKPINFSLLLLISAFIGLIIHIQFGGAFEQKTVYGMMFRTSLTFLFVIFTNKKIKKWKNQ
jgi:hypothetical protein